MDKRIHQKKEDSRWGKGASDLTPDGRTIDPKIGIILAASLPLSIIAFWKITLPLAYFTVSSILGAELIQKVNFLSQDIFSLMTLPCPLWISSEQRAFIENQSFQHVQRYHDLTTEAFNDLMDKGEPFIVTDALQDWPSSEDWSCLEFIKKYPDAEFYNWQSHEDQPLKDILSRSGYQGLDCISGEVNGGSNANEKYLKSWLRHMVVPYFMDGDAFDDRESLTGFIGVQGTGVPPHVDETCMTFMSAQITGVTSWSFSRLVIENNNVRWSRPVRSFLQPGEVIFWFPSMRFHTEVADGCSLSFNFGFHDPSPREYLEEIRTIVSSISDNDVNGNTRSNCDPDELSLVEKCSLREEPGRTVVR